MQENDVDLFCFWVHKCNKKEKEIKKRCRKKRKTKRLMNLILLRNHKNSIMN